MTGSAGGMGNVFSLSDLGVLALEALRREIKNAIVPLEKRMEKLEDRKTFTAEIWPKPIEKDGKVIFCGFDVDDIETARAWGRAEPVRTKAMAKALLSGIFKEQMGEPYPEYTEEGLNAVDQYDLFKQRSRQPTTPRETQ